MLTRKEKLIMFISAVVCIASLMPWYFGKGTFNEETYKRICSNIVIGGKKVSMPFTVNDLGDGFDVEIHGGNDEQKIVYGELIHNGKTVLNFSAYNTGENNWTDISADDAREFPINFIRCYSYDDNADIETINNISVDGMKIGTTLRKFIRKYGEPNDSWNEGSYEIWYSPDSECHTSDHCPVYYDFDDTSSPERFDAFSLYYSK